MYGNRGIVLAAGASAFLFLQLGCSPAPSSASCTTNLECDSGQCLDGRCVAIVDASTDRTEPDEGPDASIDRDVPSVPRAVGLELLPTEAELLSVDGSRPEQVFRATAVMSDGSRRDAVGVTFSLESRAVGEIDGASGQFLANGIRGGRTTVRATLPVPGGEDLAATATVTVRVERTYRAEGTPPDVADRFDGTPLDSPVARAQMVYPLDGAVMPQNVYPAEIQWLSGSEGDVFRIRLSKPHVTTTAYVSHSGAGFRYAWLVAEEAWRGLAQSDLDEPARIAVDRWIASTDRWVRGEEKTLRFARAALTGAVYYWDIERGRIVRILDGTARRDEFMPNPPPAIRGDRCVGCHVVSPTGRWMAGRLGGGDNVGAVFDLTVDLTPDPAPTVFPVRNSPPYSAMWAMASWSPDETRLVTSHLLTDLNEPLRFLDPFTGSFVPVSGTMPRNATHPAWSPDGTQIAYVTNVNRWGGECSVGDIGVLDVTGADTVGSARILHRGSDLSSSDPPGPADSYPTWSPDSRRIAFAHGSGCRSERDRAALYVMNRDGTDVVRMDRANGDGALNFQPRFSPFDSGGYYWLSFLSRRDYGNAVAGTRGSGRQQIWVTAIRKDAAPGEDPSEVPYWLPGQNTGSRNISAYWAPRACRPDGERCSVDSECCGGYCIPGSEGEPVCSPPPPERCRRAGETCSSTDDCCEGAGLSCIANVCSVNLE